jgi:hypothetical protein
MKNKKGVSVLVATIILILVIILAVGILVIILAVGIIWGAIMPLIYQAQQDAQNYSIGKDPLCSCRTGKPIPIYRWDESEAVVK